MAEFKARTPLQGVDLPKTKGAVLSEAPIDLMASVMPFQGKLAECNAVLRKKFGFELPDNGRYSEYAEGQAIWMALDQWFISGIAPERLTSALASLAAVTDQSDAWARFSVTGPDSDPIMARLCPLDLSVNALPADGCARSQFAHMMAAIQRCEGGYYISVMRSFGKTAIHHTTQTMRSVAAQKQMTTRDSSGSENWQ